MVVQAAERIPERYGLQDAVERRIMDCVRQLRPCELSNMKRECRAMGGVMTCMMHPKRDASFERKSTREEAGIALVLAGSESGRTPVSRSFTHCKKWDVELVGAPASIIGSTKRVALGTIRWQCICYRWGALVMWNIHLQAAYRSAAEGPCRRCRWDATNPVQDTLGESSGPSSKLKTKQSDNVSSVGSLPIVNTQSCAHSSRDYIDNKTS